MHAPIHAGPAMVPAMAGVILGAIMDATVAVYGHAQIVLQTVQEAVAVHVPDIVV